MNFQILTASSLCKIFPDSPPKDELAKASALKNEVFAFQIAFCGDQSLFEDVSVSCISTLSDCVTLREVCLIPSEMPSHDDHDDYIITDKPGLFPDLLRPLDRQLSVIKNQWRSIWVTVDPSDKYVSGEYPIEIVFTSQELGALGRAEFKLELIDACLPPQKLIHTQWLHTDSIINYYNVEVFSERYWELVGEFMKTAVSRGINMILTPVLTPPLDTDVGGERKTVQLVEIEKDGDSYSFNFDRLRRWISLCRETGIEYLEINHMFTQWGAEHAPKVEAYVNGERMKIFGWETDAAGAEYRAFLEQFIPALIKVIRECKMERNTYFHISDEPSIAHQAQYTKVADHFKQLVAGFPVMDALSDYEFYRSGATQNPVPALDHIEPFLEAGVPELWTYYCVCQCNQVSNRFFGMPSERNRVLGIQLYKFNIAGFLQWGYNFYSSRYSRYPIDPFCVTDAARSFPSGDAFIVYPGPNGPWASLRLEVFYEGLQDMRALELAETLCGREKVLETLEEGIAPITFKEYPHDAQWILRVRQNINELIRKKHIKYADDKRSSY